MSQREVTERDFRAPEFVDADPKDYEFRSNGSLARKDRWETAIRSIRYLLGDERREFEVSDVVDGVRALMTQIEDQPGYDEWDGQ